MILENKTKDKKAKNKIRKQKRIRLSRLLFYVSMQKTPLCNTIDNIFDFHFNQLYEYNIFDIHDT